jgi:DNA-binding response OmpR family regulator
MGARASTPPPASPTVLKGRRVLVVEDEALIAMMLEDVLREAGAEVLTAATLGEALRLVEAAAAAGHGGGLSAAVLDIDLAGERVLPVADSLARLGVPFLFATGYDAGCDRGRHGAAPVLHKPFDPHDLIAALQALILSAPPRPREPGPTPSGGTSLGGKEPGRDGVLLRAMASR